MLKTLVSWLEYLSKPELLALLQMNVEGRETILTTAHMTHSRDWS